MTCSEIKEISEKFVSSILLQQGFNNNCFNVSYNLSTYLSIHCVSNMVELGLFKTYVDYKAHFWISLNNGEIIDPTIIQFKEVSDLSKLKLSESDIIYFGEKKMPPYPDSLNREVNKENIKHALEDRLKQDYEHLEIWIRAAYLIILKYRDIHIQLENEIKDIYINYLRSIKKIVAVYNELANKYLSLKSEIEVINDELNRYL